MPGIVGIISQKPVEQCRRLVRSMVASMEHESFYVSGAYLIPEMGVYAGWVAHEHSFAAGQVFFNEGRIVDSAAAGATAELGFRGIVEITKGSFEFQKSPKKFPTRIKAVSNTNLILDTLSQLDEEKR